MPESVLSHLVDLRKAFSEAAPEDPKVISDYAWTVVKVLLQHSDEIDSTMARQLLADCLRLPIERPSKLYSTLLAAALKVAATYPEFRFAAFLRMWNVANLRPEDNERQHVPGPAGSPAGRDFPSLMEKTAKTLAHSLLLHPEDAQALSPSPSAVSPVAESSRVDCNSLLSTQGLSIHPMLVTRIKEAVNKEGRKFIFVTLTSPEGLEVECISKQLQPHPLHPLPEGKRHYVNIGQLYDCLLRIKPSSPSPSSPLATVPDVFPSGNPSAASSSGLTLAEAFLSQQPPTDVFPTEIGYLESIDQQHAHMHIFDSRSRHFVAPIQRFSREKVGDFVRFIPIIPAGSKFKTAIILTTVPSDSSEVLSTLRDIHIININKEKAYATWELTDKTSPITELLSPLQLSLGESSPTFTSGYLNLASVPDISPSDLREGQTFQAFIYLRRGKDKLKRPHISKIRKGPQSHTE